MPTASEPNERSEPKRPPPGDEPPVKRSRRSPRSAPTTEPALDDAAPASRKRKSVTPKAESLANAIERDDRPRTPDRPSAATQRSAADVSSLDALPARDAEVRLQRGATEREERTRSRGSDLPRIPPDLMKNFRIDGQSAYIKGSRNRVAFTWTTDRLETSSDERDIAVAMVRVSQESGWARIRLKGTEAFRREAWIEASARGIEADGYAPKQTDIDAARDRASLPTGPNSISRGRSDAFTRTNPAEALKSHPELAAAYLGVESARRAARNLPEAQREAFVGKVRSQIADGLRKGRVPREATIKPAQGVLLEHGPAPYNWDPQESASYYVKLRTDAGNERTIWGTDLGRALAKSGAATGQRISLAVTDNQRVEVQANQRDAQNRVIGTIASSATRRTWTVTIHHERSDREEQSKASFETIAPGKSDRSRSRQR